MNATERLFVSDALVKEAMMAGLGRVAGGVGRVGRKMLPGVGYGMGLGAMAGMGGHLAGLMSGEQRVNQLLPYPGQPAQFQDPWQPMPMTPPKIPPTPGEVGGLRPRPGELP